MKFVPPSHIITIYIDAISPLTIKKMPPQDMAQHFIDVLTRLSQKFPGIKIKQKRFEKKLFECNTIEKQIDLLLYYLETQQLQTFDTQLAEKITNNSQHAEIIRGFQNACYVMLYNHLAYITDLSNLKISSHSIFIATQDTIEQCSKYLEFEGKNLSFLGWDRAKGYIVRKIKSIESVIIKHEINHNMSADHYSIVNDNVYIDILANTLNDMLTNDNAIKFNAFCNQTSHFMSTLTTSDNNPNNLTLFIEYINKIASEISPANTNSINIEKQIPHKQALYSIKPATKLTFITYANEFAKLQNKDQAINPEASQQQKNIQI